MSIQLASLPTMLVVLPVLWTHDPAEPPTEPPETRECLICALCPICGGERGHPVETPVIDTVSGRFCTVSIWWNPCGHMDRYRDVWAEVWLQCARAGCVAPAVAAFDPFCSRRCAGVRSVSSLRDVAADHPLSPHRKKRGLR